LTKPEVETTTLGANSNTLKDTDERYLSTSQRNDDYTIYKN